MKKWNGKKILVVGLAKSGVAAARLLRREGAEVRVTEAADTAEIRERAKILQREGVLVEIGRHTREFCEGVELVVTSPGVSEEALPLAWAREERIPVWSELELGFQFAKGPIVAVTGSNGKTTTTTLLAEMLRAAGKKAVACGNIGTPLCDVILEGKPWDFLVVEVSSFQLERIEKFRPFVAVLLNLTQNHLDRHKTFEAYARAKLRVFENQKKKDWAILRAADEKIVNDYGPERKAQIIHYDRGHLENAEQIQLIGKHNRLNILAAQEAARICGAKPEAIRQVLSRFTGVAHRLEKVRVLDGVAFVNDSKATTVDAVLCALDCFPSIVWIAGGRDKGSDFSPLARKVREKVRHAILIGEAREKIAWAVGGAAPWHAASTLEEAVRLAFELAKPGDTVLLAPGCASFDMFANYEERGEKFKKAVLNLESKNLEVVKNG